MTGIPGHGIQLFEAAAADLRGRGLEIVSPAELDDPAIVKACLASDGDIEATQTTWGNLLARDVRLIADGGIEAVIVLPGFERSRGARLEVVVGCLCELPILSYPELIELKPSTLRRVFATITAMGEPDDLDAVLHRREVVHALRHARRSHRPGPGGRHRRRAAIRGRSDQHG